MLGLPRRIMIRREPADHDRLARCAGTALRAEGDSAPFYPPFPIEWAP
jgi:hypothetical protein